MKHIFYFIIKSRIFILISVFYSSRNCQDCCRFFCDCCYSDIITEEDIITEKDEDLTPKIFKHHPLEEYYKGYSNPEVDFQLQSKHEDNSTKHVKIDKLLGVKIYQKEYHYFSIVNYNGIWYNKNTLKKEQCKKMTVPEILKLFNKILGIEKINYKDFDKSNCHFLFLKLYEVQN